MCQPFTPWCGSQEGECPKYLPIGVGANQVKTVYFNVKVSVLVQVFTHWCGSQSGEIVYKNMKVSVIVQIFTLWCGSQTGEL